MLPSIHSEAPWLLTAAELARLLQVSTRTLWRLRSSGRLPSPVRIGGTVRWALADIKKWLAEGCPAAGSRENDSYRI